MASQFWFVRGCDPELVGTAVVFAVGKARTAQEQANALCHGIVPVIAACAYFAMAVGQGSVMVPAAAASGRLFFFARYVDWSFTTPLLLLPLALAAVHSRPRRGNLIAGMLLADLLMIVTAFRFGASTIASVEWIWYAVSCVAFLAVLWVMWLPLGAENAAEPEAVRAA